MRHSLALILALTIAGCSLLPDYKKDESETWSVSKLYQEAKAELDDENYVKATDYLEKLEARFPYGRYAQQAQLELIYVYFKNDDSASAIAEADRFIKYHPNST
ncbi:MAG TPA: outer membrane protein assembly factor BamD, partial [Burkholderiales bacterium]|nr:outer membrane protein assembly factor BamD [Burkholderiales bacterium]